MIFHIAGLPWADFTSQFLTCAYTQKVIKFSRMMMDRGHKVYLYGGAKNEAPCTKHFTIFTPADRAKWFGKSKKKNHFDSVGSSQVIWDMNHPCWVTSNARMIEICRKTMKAKTDIICILAGHCQRALADAFPANISCEPFVGYTGFFTPFRAFESQAWRHFVYGKMNQENGTWLDTVISAYIDPAEFPYINKGNGDYLLFLGRLVTRKGVTVASDIAKQAGMKLKIAGPGALEVLPGMIRAEEFTLFGKHVEYCGVANQKQRAKLIAGAKAVLMPTYFLEPGGNVCGESLMCGTPVIAPDWGCMSELIHNDFNGFKFQNLPEAVAAVKRCDAFDNQAIRAHAIHNFSLEATAPKFERWFSNLLSIYTHNWDGSPLKK
jgi:glycosyltransferase involved in cell wall biosynthesis